jgi:predicted kinase
MKAVIFDIDGTLADVKHRLHYLENGKDWNGFFSQMHDDPVIEPVAELARLLYAGISNGIKQPFDYAILIVSARPDDYRFETGKWLNANHIPFQKLYMRKSGDFRRDDIVKAEILQQILDDGYEPFLVVDDRPMVVDMWRSHGITTLQCAPDEKTLSKYAGKRILTMMVGPAGAGKSTHIDKESHWFARDVVSADVIRADYGLTHSPEDLRRTWEIVHALVKTRLEIGLRTILDATNIKRKDRLAILDLVPEGQLVDYVVIDRRLEDKLADRGSRSEELVLKHHRTFVSQLPDILRGDDQGNVIVNDHRKHKV